MSVDNFYSRPEVKRFLDRKTPNPNKDLHGFDIPFRLCCVAPSGSGKSNMIVNLISLFSQGKVHLLKYLLYVKIRKSHYINI